MSAAPDPFVLLDDQVRQEQLYFADPHRILTYRSGEPIKAFLRAIDRAAADGFWLAGQLDYEFGLLLEGRLMGRVPVGQILARFGVFDAPSDHPPVNCLYAADPPEFDLKPDWGETDYGSRFDQVQDYLRAGDVYQVNLTFPMRAKLYAPTSASAIYAGYRRRQPGRYGAIVSLGECPDDPQIISFSPELFFARSGSSMRMRPMKGTRAKTARDDMREDIKSRAENLMIVDLLRNDLSRLCVPGSVTVPELFTLEDYPTLTQMTSQILGKLREGIQWSEIFKALFPCGSVTGAPKIRAMEIIHDLEGGPRGAYCGSVGYISPHGDAAFSVAIRTAVLRGQELRYDVGSGVVLDSGGGDEYAECLLKADLLKPAPPTQFETLRNGPEGLLRRAEHEARLGVSFPPIPRSDSPKRVRIDKDEEGQLSWQSGDITPMPDPLKLVISRYPISDTVQRTDIKTSRRDFYEGERERLSARYGADEVLFCNADDYLTEGSFTSVFIQMGGQRLTPRGPGLLPGIFRAEQIRDGKAKAADITLNDLMQADAIYVGNSLRGLMRAVLIDPARL